MSTQENPLRKLGSLGQCVWLDYIDRDLIRTGGLTELIEEDGVNGVTSNPAIFQKAISQSDVYDHDISRLVAEGKAAPEVYEALAVRDVRDAADLLRPAYDGSQGRYGFVSLEVNPHLARDTEGTIEEARRLWNRVDRPNILIKIPGTAEGLPAVRQCLREGINVNITLLFGLARYREVVEAYIDALEARAAEGKALERVASVASFFLSRIDVLLDPILEEKMATGGPQADVAGELRGEAAVASAKVAYQVYKELFASARFSALQEKGARTQWLLWASTSTKNPAYSDLKYVEPLIGPETVNTMPPATVDAYRDHGNPAVRIEDDVEHARRVLARLSELGIDIDAVAAQLVEEGIEKFNRPYDELMALLSEKGAPD